MSIPSRSRSQSPCNSLVGRRSIASPAELEAPVSSVLIGKGDDGIVIELVPPKQYSTKKP